MNYKYPRQQDTSHPDNDAFGIIQIEDETGPVGPRTIPPDPANTDWQKYVEWRDEGNTPLPSLSDAERLDAHKEQVIARIDALEDSVKRKFSDPNKRADWVARNKEVDIYKSGVVTPQNADIEVPFAWWHSKVIKDLGDARTRAEIAVDLLAQWEAVFDAKYALYVQADALGQQCTKAVKQATAASEIDTVFNYVSAQFETILGNL